MLAYAYNPDVNGKRLFVGRVNEPSGALDIVVAGVCHDIGVFALGRGGKRDRAGRFVGAKQLVGICALSVIGEIPAVIDKGALGERRLVIAPIARCHVIGSRGKRSADLCKVAARSDINRCQGIRLGIFALDDGITRGGIVGVVATVDDALEVLADVLLRNYERRPVRVFIRQRRERTLGAIGNLPRIRQLIGCKLGTLCSCRRFLECSNTDLFATLVDKPGVIALVADDLFEIRQEQLVRACGLNGHGSSRLYGVIARSGRHTHPALGVVIGNRKAAVGFTLDNMPVGLRIKRRGRRVDGGPTPRVGNALGNRFRRVVDRLVGTRLNRRASVLSTLARVGKRNRIKRCRALGQNATRLGFAAIGAGDALLGLSDHLEVTVRALLGNRVGVTSCNLLERAVGGIGHPPRKIDLVGTVEVSRRVVVEVVGSSLNRVADVGVGDVLVIVAKFGAVIGENDMAQRDLAARGNGARGIVANRRGRVERSARTVQLLAVADNLNANVLARKLRGEFVRNR